MVPTCELLQKHSREMISASFLMGSYFLVFMVCPVYSSLLECGWWPVCVEIVTSKETIIQHEY